MMDVKRIFRNGTVFSVIGVLILIGVIWYFGVRGLLQRISDQQREIQQFGVARGIAQKKLERLPEFQAQYDLIMREEGRIFLLLPEQRIVDFVKETESLAEETGNVIEIEEQTVANPSKANNKPVKGGVDGKDNIASPSKEEKSKGISDNLPHKKDLRIKIHLTGEYGNVLQFLHKLETLHYALDVISLDVTASTDESTADYRSGTTVFGDVSTGDGTSMGEAPLSQEPRKVQATLETAVYLE